MAICFDCPRRCGAVRTDTSGNGVCMQGILPKVARAALHMWEEPCISGKTGSGAVFFTGCPLRCVYCQNKEISTGGIGNAITPARLREIFFELIAQGAQNINLVTPSHFTDAILTALEGGLPVPVVYNTGGYDSVETLKRLYGKIQVYMPDMKYMSASLAEKYSAAPDYPETAKSAIAEMYRQTGPYKLNDNGAIISGVIIRHLILPGNLKNTYRVIDWVAETFPKGSVLFSLMSQFTPQAHCPDSPELNRRLTAKEYDSAVNYLMDSGIEDGYCQEPDSASEVYIPEFDLTGVSEKPTVS